MMMSGLSPQPLDYHAAPRQRRWKRAAWITFAAAIAMVCLAAGKGMYRQAVVLYWQRQCTNYPNSGQIIASPQPATPSVLSHFLSAAGMRAQPLADGCVFLGRMQRPDGAARMVYVSTWSAKGNAYVEVIQWTVFQPASLSQPVIEVNTGNWSRMSSALSPGPTLGAILDAADPTHFTFTISSSNNAMKDTVDGFLDNNDKLTFETRGPWPPTTSKAAE